MAFWIAVGSVVIMAGWSIITATYFAFHDDVIKHLIARQAAQQYAYEDRIAELRTQIDRTTSRQLLDQEQFEQKLSELVHREAALELRADALSGIADTTGSIGPAVHGAAVPAPWPVGAMLRGLPQSDSGKQSSIPVKLHSVQASLDRVEGREIAALDQMDERYETRVRRIRAVLDDLGVKPHLVPQATGGPFVPVEPAARK